MEASIAVLSRTGARERNEDACGYWRDGGALCCVLSDGAGGHDGGHVASRLAVETVLAGFATNPVCAPEVVSTLIASAQHAVLKRQRDDRALVRMRATIVVLVLDPASRLAVWGHVGDSRLYLLRDGYSERRTKDHSLIQSLVDAGLGGTTGTPNVDRSILTAALGSDEALEPDLVETPVRVRDGDAFLLCSDGLWEHTTDSAIEADLVNATSTQDWLDRLERRVTEASKPSQDNYSAIGVWCGRMDFSTRMPQGRVG